MKPIPNGAEGQYVLRVEPAHLANRFKDSILPPVFSTPYLILIMENAALNAIKQYLEPGESAVGTRVDVRHLVATPVGREVVGHAEVTGTDGRKIFFRVWATDAREEIGTGTHERMVVDISRIIGRMRAKYGSASEGNA
jgi:fluoroacetyl-CoA thioesterase